MAADNSQNSFRRGVMSLVILGLLKKEDMYGYQLVQETERKSGGSLTTQEGSLKRQEGECPLLKCIQFSLC